MTPATVTDLLRNAFTTTFWIALPVLAAGFIAGIVVYDQLFVKKKLA